MIKSLILFSGGADSLYILRNIQDRYTQESQRGITLLTFTYGQRHLTEVERAIALGKKYAPDSHHVVLDISSCFEFTKSNLLAGSEKVEYPGVNPAWVPARNTIFLAVAMGFAETNGLREIWHGADKSDLANRFPDCFPKYFSAMEKVAEIAGSHPIKIMTPLLNLTKDQILARLDAMGIDRKEYLSGYGDVAL